MERSSPAAGNIAADRPDAGAGAMPCTQPRIAVIRNPRSHRNRARKGALAVPGGVEVIAPPTREDLAATLERLAREGIDVLVIDGGDGTVRDVLTRGLPVFENSWPKLVVLPNGKTNALAIDLDATKQIAVADAIAGIPGARPEKRRPLLVERKDAVAMAVMGFILGAGVFTKSIDTGQVAHKFGAFQGFAVGLTVVASVLHALFGLGERGWRARSLMRIRTGTDRRDLPNAMDPDGDLRFASGYSTLDAFPLGMKPFATEHGGIRYLVMDKPMRRLVALAPAILMGFDRPFLKRLGVHRGAAEQLELELGGSFILDGEAFPPGRYSVKLGPELTFLVP